MTPGTLSPAYFVLNYHSPWGQHKATIPTKEWFPTSIGGHLGSYENWNSVPIDAEDMIQQYADLMMAFYGTGSGTDSAEIWTKATPTAPSLPRVSFVITSPGTVTPVDWDKATQAQWIFRDTNFKIVKYVFLDLNQTNDWNSLTDLTGSTPAQDFALLVTDDTMAFQSRQNAEPFSFVKLTYKLNDKLRAEYGMD